MSSLGEKALESLGIHFRSHPYDYRQKGVAPAAEALGIDISAVLKTLVIELSDDRFVFLLVPGDREASMRTLGRTLGVKHAELASERDAQRLTGYQVGGISPFGSRTALSVYLDLSALEHEEIYINGGRRGLLVSLAVADLIDSTQAELVEVT